MKHLAGIKRKAIILVGPPSVGKSTWIKKNFFPDAYIINRDNIVEEIAQSYGWTYDEMFTSPPEDAKIGDFDEKFGTVIDSPQWMKDRLFKDTTFDRTLEANDKVKKFLDKMISGAHPSGSDIVIDMTNMDKISRADALVAIEGYEDDYYKIAVDFKFKGAEDIIKKLSKKRAELAARMGKNKNIPEFVFDKMFSMYEEPSTSEGFDKIISIDNVDVLKKALG